MPYDNQEIYEQITSSLNIADIVAEKVKLEPFHRGFRGLCPFHNEDTPSFFVYTDTQSFYCFGCHAGGNIFSFLMKSENLTFSEALQVLAQRAGVKLNAYEKTPGAKSYNEILEAATKYFTENLLGSQGAAARAYMERRHMDQSDISRFSLGYDLNSWDGLVNHLRGLQIHDKQILDLGLALKSKQGLYDRFRGRLVFPIKNVAGSVVAFGGRLIDGEGAKYINSPESVVYSKRKNLYLLHEARASIREKKRSILVEGYMDAIRLHKTGFTETVASLGTSLTEEQAKLLSRFADDCYICYDSDTAGQDATMRGMYILQENGVNVYVVSLPEGKDPDEFLSMESNTPEMFEEILHDAKPLIAQHIKILRPKLDDPLTRPEATKELIAGLDKLNPQYVLEHTKLICEATMLSTKSIEDRYGHSIEGPARNNNIFDFRESLNDIPNGPIEGALCAMLFHYPECRLRITPQDVYTVFIGSVAQETAIAFLKDDPKKLYASWISSSDTEKLTLLAQGDSFLMHTNGLYDLRSQWLFYYSELRCRYIKNRKEYLMEKLKSGNSTQEELLEWSQIAPKLR